MLVLVVGLLTAMAESRAAAAGWLPPASTPAGAWEVDTQDLELDDEGDAVAVWTAYGSPRAIQAATRPAGGSWSAPVTFSHALEDEGWNPKVAVGDDGDAVVVWSSVRKVAAWTQQVVLASSLEAGGEWSDPVPLSEEDGIAISYEPEVVIDAEGRATAIWGEETGLGAVVVRTRTRPRGGEWSEPVQLTDNESSAVSMPQLGADSEGGVTAVWTWHESANLAGVIQSARRSAAGTWSAPPVDLSAAGELASEPRLAVDPAGEAVAVWQSYDPSISETRVQAARRVAGTWAAADNLTHGDPLIGLPDVAVDPEGTATVIWESHDSLGRIIRSSTSAAAGSWSAPVDISVRDDSTWPGAFPRVAVDPQGSVTASWTAWYSPGYSYAQVVRREAGEAWGEPVELGRTGGVIEPLPVAVDPRGYASVAWSRENSVRSSVFDSVAPLLNDLTVPEVGVVGEPVAMSVDPFDLWSPVASSWDFGDGASGQGAAVEHCYVAPGEHTVALTGTDEAANVASAARTISIAPNPALGPGGDPCADPGPGPGPVPGPGAVPGPRPGIGPAPGRGSDRAAPVLTALTQSAPRWRLRDADRRPRLPVGTTFRFRLDRAAKVRFAFSRVLPGRTVGDRCVRVTRANRGKAPCRLRLPRGTLRFAGRAGANARGFRGKIRARARLGAGRYRLLVTATADGRRSAPAAIGFTIAP